MTKLERVEHKVFASEAPLDEMGQFGSALDTTLLNTKNIEEIQSLPAYLNGWGSAVVSENNYPTMEEMNGVLNVMSYQTGYLYQEGIPVWYDRQEYSSSSIVKGSGGQKLYCSLKDNNIGHSLTDPTWWKELEFGGGGMPVGTIFAHSASASFVPENSLACDGMEYTQTQFPSLYTNWLINGNLATCTYEEYQQEITSTGECLKWGIDTVKRTFKVPTKLNKYVSPTGGGKVPVVGNGKAIGIAERTKLYPTGTYMGYDPNVYVKLGANGANTPVGLALEANRSGIEADLSNAIKTKEIRYFVVVATGSIKQSEMDWSQWASSLEGKLNKDHSNDTVPYLKNTYANGESGYNIWSNGYCEQWGVAFSSTTGYDDRNGKFKVTFLKKFGDLSYNLLLGFHCQGNISSTYLDWKIKTNDGFTFNQYSGVSKDWRACGYLAEGEY